MKNAQVDVSCNGLTLLDIKEIESVVGAGFWYNVGKFFAEQANANDAIYRQYGNTNHNR